jgi:hypothetical protein
VITTKEIAQYALLVVRQVEKLEPLDRAAVMAVAGQLVQIEVQRALQLQPPVEVADE